MIAAIAKWVRDMAASQDWLAWLSPYLAAAPDWALLVPAPVIALLGAAWAVGSAKKSTVETIVTLRTGASMLTGGAIKDNPAPANLDQVKALQTRMQALNEAPPAQVAALEAKLDAMNAAIVAAGKTEPIGAEAKAKRNEAVVGIVAEGGAAAESFERGITKGGLDLAALKAARAERDQSVAHNTIGDVLVLAGDLRGAKSRFEAALGVSEKLAARSSGSAEARRDVLVSRTKMARTFPRTGWWARALELAQRLQAEGRLAPADEWMVEDTARQAAADV